MFLKGVSGRQLLRISKSDKREGGRVLVTDAAFMYRPEVSLCLEVGIVVNVGSSSLITYCCLKS